ncbi:MAG: hypothetical protein ACYC1C_21480 [Chloroflexota bacterium]
MTAQWAYSDSGLAKQEYLLGTGRSWRGPGLGYHARPTRLNEIVCGLGLFTLLWWAHKRLRVDGVRVLAYLTLYLVGKFTASAFHLEAVRFCGLR